MPRPSRKNSRFSGKNSLNRVRFTCCSSTSTWAKSVLYVKSAVRFCVTPYLKSSPAFPSAAFSPVGPASKSVKTPPIAYGLISIVRPPCGASRPTSVAASDTRKMPPIAPPRTAEIGSGVR